LFGSFANFFKISNTSPIVGFPTPGLTIRAAARELGLLPIELGSFAKNLRISRASPIVTLLLPSTSPNPYKPPRNPQSIQSLHLQASGVVVVGGDVVVVVGVVTEEPH